MARILLPLLLSFAFASASRISLAPVEGKAVIQPALDRSVSGDEIVLAGGTYREHVTIRQGITLRGEGNVIIDPSESWSPGWKPAADVGVGVWQAYAADEIRGLLIDGKFLAALDEKRAQKEGPWHWRTLLASGPPLGGFSRILGLYLWRKEEKKLLVSLGGDAPQAHSWRVVRRKEAVITFQGARGAVVRNVSLAGASFAVVFQDASEDCLVKDCRILCYERVGVELGGGSARCRVLSNFITRGSHESWASRAKETAGRRQEYEVWQIHKNVGFYDRMGVNVFRAGSGNQVISNHLFETFDGIDIGDYAVESLSKPLEHPEHGQGTVLAWNLIQDVRDSGMEIGGGAIDVEVHHNYLLRTHGGIRFKLPRVGPVFIHHNWLEDDRGFNFWFSMDSSPAEGYLYHNTVVGRTAALIYSSLEKGFETSGTPRWHLWNNLLDCTNGFFADWTRGALVPNFASGHNAVCGGGRPYPEGGEPGARYLEGLSLKPDLSLPDESMAKGTATNLSRARDGKGLPGCEAAADVGAGPLPGFFKPR